MNNVYENINIERIIGIWVVLRSCYSSPDFVFGDAAIVPVRVTTCI